MRASCVAGLSALTLAAASPNHGIFQRNTCNRDNCLRAVIASVARPGPIVGRADCSSFMISTVTPCPTTSTYTVWQNTTMSASTDTATSTIYDPWTSSVSSSSSAGSYSSDYANSVVSPTTMSILSSTSSSASTASSASASDSSSMTMTSIVSSMQPVLPPVHYGYKRGAEPRPQHVEAAKLRKRQFERCPALTVPTAVPTYASACPGGERYSSACSCNGVTATVTTLDPSTYMTTTTIVSTTTLPPRSTITITVTRASSQSSSVSSATSYSDYTSASSISSYSDAISASSISSYSDYVYTGLPPVYSDTFAASSSSSMTSSNGSSAISTSSLTSLTSSSIMTTSTPYSYPTTSSMNSTSTSSSVYVYNISSTSTTPYSSWNYNATSISSTSSTISSPPPGPTPYTPIGPFICSPSTGGYVECDYEDNGRYHLYSDLDRSLLMYIDQFGGLKAQGGDNFFANVALTGNDLIDLSYQGNYWNDVPEYNKLFCSLDGVTKGNLTCVSGSHTQDTFVQCGGSNIKLASGVPIGCQAVDVTCEAWTSD